jgi:hypothetical protein
VGVGTQQQCGWKCSNTTGFVWVFSSRALLLPAIVQRKGAAEAICLSAVIQPNVLKLTVLDIYKVHESRDTLGTYALSQCELGMCSADREDLRYFEMTDETEAEIPIPSRNGEDRVLLSLHEKKAHSSR